LKNFQDARTARRATRTAKNRKLHLTDGLQIAFVDWQEIKNLTGCSRSTAYRWIDAPDSIPVPMFELLLLKKLGAVPGWGAGWRVDGDGLRMPNGVYLDPAQLEHAGFQTQLNRILQAELETMAQELARMHARNGVPVELRRDFQPDKIPPLRLVPKTGT
jgi:hypothetical protein